MEKKTGGIFIFRNLSGVEGKFSLITFGVCRIDAEWIWKKIYTESEGLNTVVMLMVQKSGKPPGTWDEKNLRKNGINYLSTGAGFLPGNGEWDHQAGARKNNRVLSSSTDKLSIVEAAASNGYEARIWDNQRQLLLKQGPEDVVFLLMNTIEEMSRRGTLETEIPEEFPGGPVYETMANDGSAYWPIDTSSLDYKSYNEHEEHYELQLLAIVLGKSAFVLYSWGMGHHGKRIGDSLDNLSLSFVGFKCMKWIYSPNYKGTNRHHALGKT